MAEVIMDKKPHCWHEIPLALLSQPPQFQEVCCHCGERRAKPVYFGTLKKHGPFAPDGTWNTNAPTTTGERKE